MNPEAMQTQLTQAIESRMDGLLKVERDHITALRQIIAKGFKMPEPPPVPTGEAQP